MSTLRDLLALLPHPGRRTCGLSHAIYVQILILIVLFLGRRDAAACLAALAIIQILFIHVSTRRRERELLAELDLANTDMVTGLPTRRFVYRHIEAIPANDCVTVAFADVDKLKQINDTWGHQTGDDYLAVIAERLFAITTDGDTLVRLGGDEFALATRQTPHQLAAGLARVLAEPALIAGAPRPVRVSVGTIRIAGGDAHTALGCAEAAMRTAKRRDTVIEHYDPARDGTPPPPASPPRPRPPRRRADDVTTSANTTNPERTVHCGRQNHSKRRLRHPHTVDNDPPALAGRGADRPGLMRRRPTRDTSTAQEQQPTQRPGPWTAGPHSVRSNRQRLADITVVRGTASRRVPGSRYACGPVRPRPGPRPPIEAAEWEETHMDTKTCEICKRPPAEGNPVAPIDLGAAEPTAVCDLCCELLAAELAVLSVLK